MEIAHNNIEEKIYERLYVAEMEYNLKEKIYHYVMDKKTPMELLGILQGLELSDSIFGMLSEVLLAE
mgnify:FL=1